MKMIRLLLLLLLFALPTKAFAATTSTPVGCPYISSPSCSIPVFPNGSPYALGQLAKGSDGNVYISQVSANVGDPASATECGVNWKLWAVSATLTTVNLPAKCPTLANMAAFENAISAMSISSTIVNQLAAGTYALGTTNISLNNPFGAQISLIGDTVTPANVVITYSGIPGSVNLINHAAFELTLGHSYGTINGITFTGPGSGGTNYGNSCTLLAEGPGNVTFGPNNVVTASYCGVQARDFARIVADGIDCSGGGDGCIWAYNAYVQAVGASAHGANNGNCGCGFLSDNHAYLVMDGAFAYGNLNGLGLYNNSVARVAGSTIGQATFGKNSSGTVIVNTTSSVHLQNSLPTNLEGIVNSFDPNKLSSTFTNYIQNSVITDLGGLNQYAFLSGGNATNVPFCNGAAANSVFPCNYVGVNKAGQKAYPADAASGLNILPQAYFQSSTGASGTATGASTGTNGHMSLYVDGTDQSITFLKTLKPTGSTSGVISLITQAAAGTYNWNWPTTAGPLGYLLTSDGGGAGGGMTWTPAPAATLSGTTAAIGGGALLPGACVAGTATVTGATSSMVATASPSADPDSGLSTGIAIYAFVSSANTVTVRVCAIVAVTPTSVTYNVRVIQ